MNHIFLFLSLLFFSQHMTVAGKGVLHAEASSKSGFIKNKGQIVDDKGEPQPDILFTMESAGVKVFVGKQGLHYLFSKFDNLDEFTDSTALDNSFLNRPKDFNVSTYRLDVALSGSNPDPKVIYENATGYYENYYLAHCPEGITGVRAFGKVTLKDVYPGIDWIFYQKGNFMKYDFVLQPGADPSLIKLKFEGATELKLQEDGSLFINTPLGSITEHAPVSFNNHIPIESQFTVTENVLSFQIEPSETETLIIDPTIEWGTYYGNGTDNQSLNSTTDLQGNVFLVGYSYGSSAIPFGGHQNVHNGDLDGFMAKFDSAGTRLWATYYGGSDYDHSTGCSSDMNGNIYMSGYSLSRSGLSFNGHQNNHGSGAQFFVKSDAILIKFNSSGVRLWGTYYGGSENDYGTICSVDQNSNVYLAGFTQSSNNIGFGPNQRAFSGQDDGFIAKFDSTGTRLYGVYYGGPWTERIYSCSIDNIGNCFISGVTHSLTGIASGGHQNTKGGGSDAFLAKFSPNGSRLWGTYYGGSGNEIFSQVFDIPRSCTVDRSGNVYLVGGTTSSLNIASGGHKNSISGSSDAFLVKFNSGGNRLWATYYGGLDSEYGISCTTDEFENVFLLGQTSSGSNIVHKGFQDSLNGSSDAFLAKFNKLGSLVWASYLGGEGYEYPNTCAADSFGNIYISGVTGSHSNISFQGHQNNYGGYGFKRAFLTKIDDCSSMSSTYINACKSFYWSRSGQTYSQSGIYTDTTTNSAGCDSLVRLVLNIRQIRDTGFVKACNSFTWPINNNTYISSGTYFDTLTNPVGCDSIVQLNLTINKLQEVTENISACDQYIWPVSGKTYNANSIDTAFLQTTKGCDSILILNLTINKSSIGHLSDTVCKTYTSPSGKFTWTRSGTYTDTISNSVGCDSIISINLHVKHVDTIITQTDTNLIANAKGASYQWLNCNQDYSKIPGETKRLYKPIFNGSYAVAITQNGCTDTSACYTITGKESIDNPFGTSMAIFPNPTTDILHVRFGEPVENIHTTIWSSAGKLVSTQNFNTTDRFELNIRWAAGVYYLKISGAFGKSITVKVVKI